jgi:hypothetical protein
MGDNVVSPDFDEQLWRKFTNFQVHQEVNMSRWPMVVRFLSAKGHS